MDGSRDAAEELEVRTARASDLPAIVELDASTTGVPKAAYWKDRFGWYARSQPDRFFLVARRGTKLIGFIVGEVRAWEFGSPPTGWVFAIDIAPEERSRGVGTLLFEQLCRRLRGAGAQHVRTMSMRDAVPVMSFFRNQGMRAGPYMELEMPLSG